MRLIMLGDVVGRVGRHAVAERLPRFIEDYAVDFVVINGENSAGGFGITEAIVHDLLDAGADVITTGNHVWDQREALVFIERQERLIRPLNYPQHTPGRGAVLVEAKNGARVMVANVMGRVFMDALDDPVPALEAVLDVHRLGSEVDAAVVDVHAEATSEKQILGHLLDGRVSVVAGTHTHVPTADHRILPGGTAFITDIGMCGAYEGVIGMDKSEPCRRYVERVPGQRIVPATGEATLSGIAVDVDTQTGLARSISPVRLGGDLSEALPLTWAEQNATADG